MVRMADADVAADMAAEEVAAAAAGLVETGLEAASVTVKAVTADLELRWASETTLRAADRHVRKIELMAKIAVADREEEVEVATLVVIRRRSKKTRTTSFTRAATGSAADMHRLVRAKALASTLGAKDRDSVVEGLVDRVTMRVAAEAVLKAATSVSLVEAAVMVGRVEVAAVLAAAIVATVGALAVVAKEMEAWAVVDIEMEEWAAT